MWDFLVVGAGLTGATVARGLTDAGHSVLVVERRDRVAGNIHDQLIDGVRVHTHGPHYFRTNSDRIWAWVNRFADWSPFEPEVATRIGDVIFPWPVQQALIDELYPGGWIPGPDGPDFRTRCLSMMPPVIYERFVKGYTEKQWGVPDQILDASLAKRFDVRRGDRRLMQHKHQAIPTDGYTAFIEAVLEGIPVELGCSDWRRNRASHVVYTGTIDSLHGYGYGRLGYRGQRRKHVAWMARQQPYVQINNPGHGEHIRTIDWSYLPGNPADRTVVTTETPYSPTDEDGFEYPIPDAVNAALYTKYAEIPTPGVTICGRLGLYRYLDMDHAIAHAWHTLRTLVNHDEACSPPRDVHHPGTPSQGSSER